MSDLDRYIKNKNLFRLLLVDDKTNMRRTLRNMLRSLGFTNFQQADDGDSALKIISSEKLDFIICDWNMPRVSGLQVLRAVRQDPRFKELPFLMITGEVEEATVAESIEADVDGYIIKPFLPQILEQKMVQILREKHKPTPLQAALHAAEVHLHENEFDKAHQKIKEAARLSPKNPRVFFTRGLIFEAEDKMEQAEDAYLQARQVGPKFIKAHEKLAEMYEKQGRHAERLQALKEAVRVSPRNADRQFQLGEALLVEGRLEEAKEAFHQSEDLDPGSTERKTAMGEAYLKVGLAAEAEEAFQASLKADPNNIYVYNRLGIAFRRQKKQKEAIQLYKKALQLAPQEETLYFNLARAYMGAGHKDKAVISLQKALQLRPDFSEARQLLSKMLKR